MIKLFTGENAESEIIRLIIEPADKVKLAVAYWGDDAAEHLLSGKAQRFTIICNLESSGCNPHEIKKIFSAKIPIYTNKNLHAKMYIGRGMVAVGSSNASSNGIWVEGRATRGLHEANIITSDQSAVADCEKYFDDLLAHPDTRPVTHSDINRAKMLYQKKMLGSYPPRSQAKSEGKDIATAESYKLAGIYLAIWSEEIDQKDIEAAKQYRLHRGEDTSRHDVFQFTRDPNGPIGSLIFAAVLNAETRSLERFPLMLKRILRRRNSWRIRKA